MRILHTADWHIGQTLNGWSREYEHEAFFESLRDVIVTERIDVLLIAGDVFDGINPSGEAQRLLYAAIAGFLRVNPKLQIVMTAGNHDPAQRLEAPEALLKALGVHVLGTLRRGAGGVDIDRHLIPLSDSTGTVRAHVLAVPFLRQADLPGLQLGAVGGAESAVTAAVRALHLAMSDAAKVHAGGLPIIAMGHLTCAGGLESQGAERRILIGCGFYFQISIRGMSYASWVLALNWRRFSANDFSEALCQSDFTIEARRRRARSWTSTGRWRVEWPASWTKSWMAAIRNMLPSNARRLNCGSPPGKSIISWPVTEPIAL